MSPAQIVMAIATERGIALWLEGTEVAIALDMSPTAIEKRRERRKRRRR